MNYLNIKVPKNTKLAIITDVHEHSQQFFEILEKIKPSSEMWLVFAGDAYDKGYGPKEAEKITDSIKLLAADGYAYAIRGNHELKVIREARKNNAMTPQLKWFERQPLALSFQFVNNTRLTVVHGGVLNSFTWNDLKNNIEIAFIRNIDENGQIINSSKDNTKKKIFSWHEKYQGKFSYIVAGHTANRNGKIKLYNYSANIDSCVYGTGILSAMIFGENGIINTLQVEGPPANPINKEDFSDKKEIFISKPIK